MSNNSIVLLLGTNLGDKNKNLEQAQQLIEREIGTIEKKSEILESKAEDYESDELFWNQTIRLKTDLSPIQLLDKIKKIEELMGRTYENEGGRYQDRVIDIDLLTFNELKYNCERLKVPHHQIKTRKFIKLIKNYLLKG